MAPRSAADVTCALLVTAGRRLVASLPGWLLEAAPAGSYRPPVSSASAARALVCAILALAAAVSVSPTLPIVGVAAIAGGAESEAASGVAEWNQAALESALSYAQSQRSSAVVIVDHGRVIAERYWFAEAGAGSQYTALLMGRTREGAPIEDVASLQKSIVSVLVGIAADRGLLDLDAPVSSYLRAGWTNSAPADESAITVRHLLSMTSGLSPSLASQAPAGSVWQYNTRAYSRLVDVLEVVSGEGIGPLTRRWLTGPAGMHNTEWRRRPWVSPGMDANPVGLCTTARDLVRFGELMLAGGVLEGRRLVSAGYVAAAVEPSQSLNPAYGLLWWLNGRRLRTAPEAVGHATLAPAAPGDMYAAQGALGRKLYVVPSLGLVVARLGDEPEDRFNQRFWELLIAAAPAAAGPP